ncbi:MULTISPECIES: UDP-3-O-(3-hydroxymyristoyl)glucosamine N-acyltransferase [unclassified Pseudoalteromonas]|uniref:UDP-3-O-(3-hydroxymyristoyl)glucosamine N-acyltransferase n=2 Tax=unclassified Pseudoalteromonas TaxID=194690 RepID=UPI000CF5E725|nr:MULTISPECIES: UDP-3-O-(3-hydroxymyristoyl)glucosamine N-acyltransferase [unclassified Pseudoalteromonas]MBS3798663.1 UDP-3-O-(3-hydroxymyristoyl)glucosamine N-acyltransferase [Pseudoalteromonas sp. BDTF-M6]
MMAKSLADIAQHLGAELIGDGTLEIVGIQTLEKATAAHISFLANKKYRSQLADTQAGAVILSAADAEHFAGNKLVCQDPYVAYAKLAQLLDSTPASAVGIHPSAVISPDAKVSASANIGPLVVIEAGAVIGDHAQIGSHCFIGKDVQIGAHTKLWNNVTVYHQVQLGEHCLVQANTVIGADGFGYANERGQWVKIPQIGSVIIGNRVEIGASTTIDRGAIDDTLIHDNVIIDNQCQIAHNVEICEGTAIAGCTVVAGSTKIGRYCQIGGLSAITGHVEICDKVVLTGMNMVTSGISEPGIYSSGLPHSKNKEWRRTIAHLRNIGDMNKRIKAIEAELKSQE